jgi:hypothetical protein
VSPRERLRVCLCGVGQPHTQLLCVTARAQGTVRVGTAAGAATAPYDSAELLLPPIITSVVPTVWGLSEPTSVVIQGER